jgi:uncharacterized protein
MWKKNIILYLIILNFLFFGCNKPKIQYWPPSQYGEKVKKSEENYKNGKKAGLSTWWHVNGNIQMECNYSDGKLNGTLKRWYYNGNQERIENYLNDLLDGYSKTYYKEGEIESEVNYKNGLLNGDYKFYWENGELKVSGEYLNGLFNGKWNYYDYTGIKTGEAQFIKGDGKQIEYSIKTGSKIKETNYIKNKKNGLEIWWDDSGKKIKENLYTNDTITKSTLY